MKSASTPAHSLPSFVGGDLLLFVTALIWGFAFVAQRVGMESLGPFAFNAARYLVGALSLLPIYLILRRARVLKEAAMEPGNSGTWTRGIFPPLIAGGCMFLGASLQQVGMVTTTAGNAAFITSLYVVIVPFIGMVFGRKVGATDWLASLVAVAGLWFITMSSGLAIAPGDLLELIGAFFWALHIIIIGRFASHYDPIKLSIGQFMVAGLLSLAVSACTETTSIGGLSSSLVPILYGGVISCGIAFTLQIFGQRRAKPSHASIILALEGLFGAIGGILLIGEPATPRILIGGSLMIFAAMLPHIVGAFSRGAKTLSATSPGD